MVKLPYSLPGTLHTQTVIEFRISNFEFTHVFASCLVLPRHVSLFQRHHKRHRRDHKLPHNSSLLHSILYLLKNNS